MADTSWIGERLLAQRNRIVELEAAMHALVDDDDALGWWDDEGSLRCPHCLEWLYEGKVEPQHQPDCPVQQARELLGKGDG
jgi:hypothetical protein